MKPPPPILPARGSVTASAKPTATAASTALPPRSQDFDADPRGYRLLADHHAMRRHHGPRDGEIGDDGLGAGGTGGRQRGAEADREGEAKGSGRI